MAYVFATGTSAVLTDVGGGNSITLNVTSVGGVTKSMAMSEISLVSDTTIIRAPSGRTEPGQVTVECLFDDTATATNHLTVIKARMTSKTGTILNLDLPGSTIDAICDYTGFVMSVTEPTFALGDDVTKFSFTMQITTIA